MRHRLPQQTEGSITMIHITKIDDLSFNVRFDPAMTDMLSEEAGWSSPERALYSILSDALLGPSFPSGYFDDLDDDVPF